MQVIWYIDGGTEYKQQAIINFWNKDVTYFISYLYLTTFIGCKSMMKLHALNLFLENFSIIDRNLVLFPFGRWAKAPNAPGPPHYQGFAIPLRRTTVGRLLCTSDQTVRETCTWQHAALQRDIHPRPCGIRIRNSGTQADIEPNLRRRGHWNRLLFSLIPTKSEKMTV